LYHFQAALKHLPAGGSEAYEIQKEIQDLKSPGGKKTETAPANSY